MKKDQRAIDLIIKPTEACNFACSFCSSSFLVEKKTDRLSLEKVFDFLRRFPNTNTIIVNGGDPTMMPVEYYLAIIDFLEKNDLGADISITTNLWKFWKEWQSELDHRPWTDLFRNPRVNVTTSFQYGDGRRITVDKVFTEDMFIEISNLMLEKVGYRPSFISVIEEKDLPRAIENVRLAKSLGVDCKLNYANKSGSCGSPLPLSSIYSVYLDILREGLADYEWNTRQMLNRIHQSEQTMCPLNRACDSGIRVIQPDGRYYSCGAFGDDQEYEIDFNAEVYENKFFTPLKDSFELHSLKDECYGCKMFQICNGCKKHVSDLKSSQLVDIHCEQMKTIADDIEEASLGENYKILNDIHQNFTNRRPL